MTKLNRSLCVAVSVIATFAFAGSAGAADSATCQFGGVAGGLNPPVPSIQQIVSKQGPADVSGTFILGADATCVKADSDTGDTLNNGVFAVRISSTGIFHSFWCGAVVSFYGRRYLDTSFTSMDQGWEGPVSAIYRMDAFGATAGGSGAIIFFSGSNGERSGLTGGGTVNLLPLDGSCAGDGPVSSFSVLGSFSFVV